MAEPTLTASPLQVDCNLRTYPLEDAIATNLVPTPDAGGDDSIAPLGGLSAPEPVELGANFLDLAVVEIRYDVPAVDGRRVSTFSTPQGLAIRDLAAAEDVKLPSVESTEREETRLDITPAGPVTQASRSVGVQLSSSDRKLAMTVFTDVLTVQHTDYALFGKSLRPALRAALVGVQQELSPDTVRRVGLRYVNRLVDTDARTPNRWVGRIHPAVVGVLAEANVASKVLATQQQIQLDFGDAAGATIRHGAFADPAVHGAYSYVVDLDIYCQATDLFNPETVLRTVRQLNVTALSLFQWIVLPEWRATMRPMPIERSSAAGDRAPEDARSPDTDMP